MRTIFPDPLLIGSRSRAQRCSSNRRALRLPFQFRYFALNTILLCAFVIAFTCPAAHAQDTAGLAPQKFTHAPPTLPITDFYATPDPLPPGLPGELIRSAPFYEYQLSYKVSVVRILYHSRSPTGQDVAASGVVLIPDKTPPPGGWPVIAWAHEFTGSAPQCAPSLVGNLNDGPLLSMYAGLGFAVVASDYAGLGANFPHAAFDMRSNALDVLYAVRAARAALPQLARKWLVAGYAQGGLVAVGVAEAAAQTDDPNFLGAIAISGVADPAQFFSRMLETPTYSTLLFLAKGLSVVFPEFHPPDILTPNALPLYEYLNHACQAGSGPPLPADRMLQPAWQENRYVKEFFARNNPGQRSTAAPLLIISGGSDPDVPSSLTATAVAQLCRQKDRVVFISYPNLASSALIGNSVSEQVSWIRARFAGRSAPTNCP
jgi:hypothetical protein